MHRTSLYITLFLLAGCTGNRVAKNEKEGMQTMFYGPSVSTITGVIEKQEVYGPPGYGKDRNVDRKDSIYVILTEQEINVFPDTAAKYGPNDIVDKEFGLKHFQLSSLPGGNAEKYLGREVKIKGSFYHGISGEHRTKVLMAVKEME